MEPKEQLMVLTRRQLLRAAAALTVLPALPVEAKSIDCGMVPDKVYYRKRNDVLRFALLRYDHDEYFIPDKLLITKGEQKAIIAGWQDLIDCNGLCASDELAQIAIATLEYGPDFLDKTMPVLRLSNQEKAMIYRKLRKLRGPHKCVHQT